MYITDEDNPRLPFLRDKTSKLTTSPGCYIMKNKMKKMVAGMMLVCSLLTLFGGVSSDGIAPCAEVVIENEM